MSAASTGVETLPVKEDQLFAPYAGLIAQENALPNTVEQDKTIRVRVLDLCGMTCNFCHNEGVPVQSTRGLQAHRVSVYAGRNGLGFLPADITASDKDAFVGVLSDLMDGDYANELHWTGGEPTLSRDLPTLTEAAKGIGYRVKMTSNGQSGAHRLRELALAGLDGVNFSIFGTTPEELAATQGQVFRDNIRLAEVRMRSMRTAMKTALGLGIGVKANVVISGEEDIERGVRLLGQMPDDVQVRYQADTGRRRESLAAIYGIMSRLGAVPTASVIEAGSSLHNLSYRLPNGRTVTYKKTTPARLPDMCRNCGVDAAGKCHEGYYGLRMYKDIYNRFWLSGCIQRMDTSQPIGHFLEPDSLGSEVLAYRKADLERLRPESHRQVVTGIMPQRRGNNE